MNHLQHILFYCLIILLGIGGNKLEAQVPLVLGDLIEKDLKPGDKHDYQVELTNGQFFFASLMGYNFDMIVSVFDPAGNQIHEFDDNGIAGEFIRIHAHQTGTYQITISPYVRERESGRYELEVIKLQTSASNKEEKIDELCSFWEGSKGEEVPGIAIALVKDGTCIYQKEYGKANLEYRIPLSSSSVFDLASLAKQFTGMAIALLIDQGKLTLKDDVRTFIPELPEFEDQILIEDLIYHKSGLRGIGGLFSIGNFGSSTTYGEQVTAETVLEALKTQQELNFPVGTEHSYSNTGYILLAIVIERITGMTFREWMQKHIFEPLEMTHSFANDNPDELIPHRATAYYYLNGKMAYRQENGMALIGSSAIYSTTDDLVKWVNNFDHPIVGNESVFEMMHSRGRLLNGEEIDYGFGVNIRNFKGLQMIEHSGYTHPGFQTNIARFPDQHFSVILLSNWADLNPVDVIAKYIPAIYLEEFIPPQKPKPAPNPPIAEHPSEDPGNNAPPQESQIEKEDVDLHTYAGYYYSPELRIIYELVIDEERLFVSGPNAGETELEVVYKDYFRSPTGFFDEVRFERGDNQQIIGFRVSQGQRTRHLRFDKWR
ncbi:MAG: serine hydrolase domain-containing protein [Bacteroidota bacterium]